MIKNDLIPSWEVLRIVGKSRIVGLTVLMPFVGYLILFNETLISYIAISKEILEHSQNENASISRLYYIYFGLLSLGISSIFYAFCCPKELKNDLSETEYLDSEIKVITEAKIRAIIKKLESQINTEDNLYKELDDYWRRYDGAMDIAFENKKGLGDSAKERMYVEGDDIKYSSKVDILRFNWQFANKSRLFPRIVIAVGYVVGFFLIAIPSAIVFIQILENVMVRI